MEKITLNMTPSACLTTCHASQYDIGRQVRFDLFNGADAFVLSGAETVTLKIRRADGVLVENAVPNTSSNYVIWTSAAGECDAAGVSECELRVTDGADVLGSANFLMSVEADAYDGQTQIKSASGAIATFETGLADALVSAVVNVNATGGNGTPDNPNPINGYSSANITRCGVNLAFDEIESCNIESNGKIQSLSGYNLYIARVIKDEQYIINQTGTIIYAFYDSLPDVGSTSFDNSRYGTSNGKFTALITGFVVCRVLDTATNIQIEHGTQSTSYTPYNGNTYTIAFGQTVYGGVLDVTRGKLHVTHGYVPDMSAYNFTKELSGGKYHYYSGQLPNAKHFDFTELPNALCSEYPVITRQSLYAGNFGCAFDNTSRFYVYNADYDNESTTETDFKNAMTGVSVAYELATPFDIDLTPEVISAVVGVNNVFGDCGDIAVEYLDLL